MKRRALLAFLVVALLLALIPDATAQRRRGPRARRSIPVEDDVKIGMATVEQIEADPRTYPVLSADEYPEAYEYLLGIIDRILASPAIEYEDLFAYRQVKIIRDDDTLNAFCTAGGFIYVYTGLIKYVESEDHLAGVLGHEIAHAEERHVVESLQKQNRQRLLKLGAVLASPGRGELAAIFAGLNLVGLKYGRSQENESDARSVEYLSSTDYACDAAAGFFEKMMREGGPDPPAFLSTHPGDDTRVRKIGQVAEKIGCSTVPLQPESFETFKASLP